MHGLSPEVFTAACTVLVVLTVGMVAWLEKRPQRRTDESATRRLDLLRYRPVATVMRWRPFQFIARLPFVAFFLFIIVAGFFGSQAPGKNIAPVLTWTIWWAGLIIAIPFVGKMWCFVCPWNAIAEWVQRFTFWGVKSTTTSLNVPWPKSLRNLYPAITLFVVLTWLELGFGVTANAMATAALATLMLILAVLPAMYFDRKPFCRYGCFVGMVSGAYAQLAAVEVRARDREVCRGCRTKDCLNGNEKGYGCPVSVYPGSTDRDTYCIQCAECAKTCPNHNIAFNLRGFASSVIPPAKLRADEAYMVLVVLGLTFFHSIAMAPGWADAVHAIRTLLGGSSWALVLVFFVGMLLILAVPAIVYLVAAAVARSIGLRDSSLRGVFVGFVYILLPVALFYHLAHNLQHLLREGQALVPLLSDPLGRGWNLFGTSGVNLVPLVSLDAIGIMQVALILLGQAYGVYLAYRVSRAWDVEEGRSLRTLVPLVSAVLLLSLVNLYLLSMPMQMRIGDTMPGHNVPGGM